MMTCHPTAAEHHGATVEGRSQITINICKQVPSGLDALSSSLMRLLLSVSGDHRSHSRQGRKPTQFASFLNLVFLF